MGTHQWPDQTLNLEGLRIYNDARLMLNHSLRLQTEKLCARKLTFGEIDFLKSSNVYYIMQFFYFFQAYGMGTQTSIDNYGKLHDEEIKKKQEMYKKLAEDEEKEHLEKKKQEQEALYKNKKQEQEVVKKQAADRAAIGNSKYMNLAQIRRDKKLKLMPRHTRFDGAFITPYRAKIIKNITEGRNKGLLRFALSDLQRLMVEVMVEETCSSTCWKLDELTLIKYRHERSGVIIDSPGFLEECFRDHLTFLVDSIRQRFTHPDNDLQAPARVERFE